MSSDLTTQPLEGEVLPVVNPDDTQGIVEGILPYFPDDTGKTRYLSFRSVGYNVHESCSLTKISYRTVMRWRVADVEFRELDTKGLSVLRDKVGANYLRMEWGRNFRLVLDRDSKVLEKAAKGKELTKSEDAYLRRIRGEYTPQAMAALEEVLSANGKGDGKGFDLTAFVLGLSKQNEEVSLSIHAKRG